MPRMPDPGPFPGSCEHMAYVPRTLMVFPGDIQHDFRDHQLDLRLDTISRWYGRAADHYLRGWRILGRPPDAIADCLCAEEVFDARTLWAAHDLLAAHWRARLMAQVVKGPHTGRSLLSETEHGDLPDRMILRRSYNGRIALFRFWLNGVVDAMAHHAPEGIRLTCLAVMGEHLPGRLEHEIDLYDFLMKMVVGSPLPTIGGQED